MHVARNCLKLTGAKLHASFGFRQFWAVACNLHAS